MQRVVRRFFYHPLASPLPWWGPLVLGAAAVAVGFGITLKPFTTLAVLVVAVAIALLIAGISDVTSGDSGAVRLVGVCLIVAALLVVGWPHISIRVLAIVAGACLLAGGVVRIVSGIADQVDDRVIATMSGVARVIFGALVLAWPGLTVLIVALLVGPAMIVFGLGECASALRRRSGRHHWPPRLRLAGVTASLMLALGLLVVSALAHRSSTASAAPDPFYRPPATVPSHPGVLVRTQPMTAGIPATARAWRILYTTTRRHGKPALASGIVIESRHVPPGPRPVIAWAHGTTGFAQGCAPSLMKAPFADGGMPALSQVLDHGWIVIATDYTGLGTSGPEPYLIGQVEARSLLDSVRAVRGQKFVDLANRTVIWGHSQGGGAALWAGMLAPHYAPSADVIGVAALSPMTELPEIMSGARGTPLGKVLGSYLLSAYSASYSDVKLGDYVLPKAQTAVQRAAARCLSGPEQLTSARSAAPSGPMYSASPATGPLGLRLTQNIPVGRIHAPLLITQGLSDTLVRPQYQSQYVNRECALHQRLEYHTYKGFDHASMLLDPSSPLVGDLLDWTEARLDRIVQPAGCHTKAI